MTQRNAYFLIPLDPPAGTSAHPTWFVTWSEKDTSFCLSTVRPAAALWAVVAAAKGVLTDAICLGEDGKDIPPPQTFQLGSEAPTQAAFKVRFQQWLTGRNDVEKPGV